tara:strand:- start:354 stop:497 length:144 start_codon:yes stop_codon:yes gene_type:complete
MADMAFKFLMVIFGIAGMLMSYLYGNIRGRIEASIRLKTLMEKNKVL